jgi:WD40 repeat protein
MGWDATTGNRLFTIPDLGGEAAAIAFTPDSRMMGVASRGFERKTTTIFLIELATGRLLTEHLTLGSPNRRGPGPGGAGSLCFSRDGRRLALGCTDSVVCIWDWTADPDFDSLPSVTPREAWSVAFSPDSQSLAVGYDDEKGADRAVLQIWDVRTRSVKATLSGHHGMVSAVAYSPDGRTLASASYDRTIKLWDVADGRVRTTLTGHTGDVRCLAFSPDGRTIISGSKDRSVKAWNVATGTAIATYSGNENWVSYVAYAPDGKKFAMPRNGTVCLHESSTGKPILSITDAAPLRSFTFAPDGLTLAASREKGGVGIWDTKSGSSRINLIGHTDEVWATAYTPDGKTLATAGKDGTVRLWQTTTGRELIVLPSVPFSIHSLAFSPDGTVLAAALHDGTVRLWQAPRGMDQ